MLMNPILGFYGIQDQSGFDYPVETHDHAICRIEDGCVVRHIALERWTRRKHDNQLHAHVEKLAELGFFSAGESPIVACADSFSGRAFISSNGRWRVEASPFDPLSEQPIRARGCILSKEIEAWIVPHELSHIGSSLPFLGRWSDDTLLIHYDGAASQSCCSAWLWRNGQLKLLHFGWDLFAAVSEYGTNELAMAMLGHGWHNFLSVPGKLMGLAAWGCPDPEVRNWLDRHNWFVRLQKEERDFAHAARTELGWLGEFHPDDQLIRTVAACFQQRFEESVLAFVGKFRESTGARRLVLTGGGAHNLPTNQLISDQLGFEDVFVPPCAGDDGLALGAASIAYFLRYGALSVHSPFLNNLGTVPLAEQPLDVVNRIADAIAEGRIVGTCLGAAELGPRALGHRSLLVRPTTEDARRLSVARKQREPWRPVAPLILAELADRFFEGSPSTSALARYMLGRFPARDVTRLAAPGVVHADGTARVQVVDESPELRPLRALLTTLYERYQIPCVVNTSFNCRGEPIVQTLDQARESGRQLGIDLLWHDGGIESPCT